MAHCNGSTTAGRIAGLVRPLGVGLLVVVIAVGGAPPGRGADAPAAVPGRLLLTVLPGVAATAIAEDAAELLEARGRVWAATPAPEPLGPTLVRAHVPPGAEQSAAADLARLPGVVAAEPDHLLTPHARPDDPHFSSQWAHTATGAEAGWDVRTDAIGIDVAVIDTGVRGDHGSVLTAEAETLVRGLAAGSEVEGLLIGGGDLVADEVGARLEQLLATP